MAARVELSFPYSADPQPSLKEQKSRITTVVADDSETFLEVVSHVLDMEDVIDLAAAVSDGVEAIDAVVHLRPALVILDVYMPGLDGISAATLMSGLSPAPIVVLMSSEDSPRLREACRRAGAFAFVHKMTFQRDFPELVERIVKMRDEQWTRESA